MFKQATILKRTNIVKLTKLENVHIFGYFIIRKMNDLLFVDNLLWIHDKGTHSVEKNLPLRSSAIRWLVAGFYRMKYLI
jgi:hypothetical protein